MTWETETVPNGWIRVSSAISRLQGAMFAGVRRPLMVGEFKKSWPRASIGFGPQRQKSAETIHRAILCGDLPVHVLGRASHEDDTTLLPVPTAVLAKIPKARGCVPDHCFRISPSLVREGILEGKTLVAMLHGPLLLDDMAFKRWYESERRKGKWPSQRGSKHRSAGRPRKQTDALRNRIQTIVNAGEWCGEDKVSVLHRKIFSGGHEPTVSHDTLARVVDDLFIETGDAQFRRRRRRHP
jgi:hypothetical protein